MPSYNSSFARIKSMLVEYDTNYEVDKYDTGYGFGLFGIVVDNESLFILFPMFEHLTIFRVNKERNNDTLVDIILESRYHKDLSALHFEASPPLSPAHIADADPEELKEDLADYPADGGDDNDEPSGDDTNDEDEEEASEEEEEHLAMADSFDVPIVDHVPSAEDT
ncbi:hypothetical protein Tco_0633247 [Tanacetum coccineum]